MSDFKDRSQTDGCIHFLSRSLIDCLTYSSLSSSEVNAPPIADSAVTTPAFSEDNLLFFSEAELIPFYVEDPVSCCSVGGPAPVTSEQYPVTWYSDGDLCKLERDHRIAAWFSKRQDENPALCPPHEERALDSTATDSSSTSRPKTLWKRFQRFCKRVTAPLCCCCCSMVED